MVVTSKSKPGKNKQGNRAKKTENASLKKPETGKVPMPTKNIKSKIRKTEQKPTAPEQNALHDLKAENAQLRELLEKENRERKSMEDVLQHNELISRELTDTAQRQAQELALLDRVRFTIASKLDMPTLLRSVVESIVQVYGYTHVSIYLLKGDELVLQYQLGYKRVFERIGIHEGISGKVARTGRPVLIEDVKEYPEFLEAADDLQSEITVPLMDNNRVVGTLSVESTKRLTEADLKILIALSVDVGVAIGRARLYEDVQRRNRTLSALQESTLAIMGQLELSEALQAILTQAAQLIDTSHGYIYLVQEDDTLKLVTGMGVYIQYINLNVEPGEGLAGKVWQSASPLIVNDYERWEGRAQKFAGTPFHAVMGVPLLSEARVAGVLGLSHLEPDKSFDVDDIETLSRFAQLASIAIKNAALYTQIHQELVERKEADKRLRASEERLAAVMEGSQLGYSDWNIQTGEVSRNKRWAEMLGYTPEEIEGNLNQWHELLHPADRETAVKALEDHLNGKTPIHRDEYRLRTKDGSYRWILDQGRIIEYDEQGRPLRLTATHTDITERKQAEQALRESEEKYRNLVEHTPAIVYLNHADEMGTNFYISPQVEKILGYPPAVFSENPAVWHNMIHPEDYERTKETIKTTIKNNASVEEYRMITRDGRVLWIRDTSILIRDEAGQPKYIQGFLEDITEQKQAEESLRKSEQRLQAFFNQSLDGFFFCDFGEPIEWKRSKNRNETLDYIIVNKRFTDVNDAMLKQYGINREVFLNLTTKDMFAHDLEQGRELRRKLFDKGHLHLETHERTANGTPVWFEGDYVCLYDEQERITGFFGIQRDITERKHSESELKRHTQNTITMYELSQNIHTGLDLDQVYQEVHSAVKKLMPCDSFMIALLDSKEQQIKDVYLWDQGKRWEGEEYPIGEGLTSYIISNAKPLFVNEWTEAHTQMTRSRHFGGTEMDTNSVLAVPLFGTDGSCFGMMTAQAYPVQAYTTEHEQLLITLANQVSKAIENANLIAELKQELTERRRAEMALRESEANLEEAQRIAHLGSWTWVAATDTPVWSRELCAILEVDPDQPPPSVAEQSRFYTPESMERMNAAIARTMETGEPYVIELEGTRKDGSKRWLLARGERWYDEQGNLIGLRGTALDITDNKLAEQALRESEERYRTLFTGMLDGVYRSTHDGKFMDVNPAMVKMFGYSSREEMLEIDIKKDLYFSPEERNSLFLDTGQEKVDEFRMKRKDGSEIWVEDHGHYIHDENGNVIYHEGILRDITERKKAEDALKRSEAFTKSIVENEPECVKIVGADGILQYMNPAGLAMIEAESLEPLIGKSVYPIVAEKDRQAFIELTEKVLQGGQGTLRFEIIGLKGTRRWLDTHAVPLYDEHGKITALLGLTRDITERMRAAEAVREAEEKYHSIFENSVEGIYQSSPEGRFYTVNPAFAGMMGYSTPQEMMLSITDIARQVYVETDRRKDFIKQLEEQGSITGFEYQMRRKDGSLIWVSENARLVRNTDGSILYYEGFLEDITARKQNEQRIDNQLRQLNALHAIDNAINSNFDLRTTLDVILREVIAQLHADATSVLLFNKESHTLDYTAGRGFLSKAIQHTKLNIGEGYAGRVILDRRMIYIPDLTKTENNRLTEALNIAGENFAAYIGTPLIAKGQVVGVLEIFQRSPHTPKPDWFDFLSIIADQAAIAIDNAQLFENLQRSNFDLTLAYDATIEGWSRALDLRDHETEGHTRRVTNLTVKLARQMGIPDSDILHIRRGALLHDIGKMGIPDSILHKPDKLTREEWDIMRQHTNYAYQMLTPIKYLKPALDIPRHHHEKWDGTGYPDGLKGEQIPIAARIFAVVDVWDALTSDRSYRDAWTREKAIEYIRSESGKHFDPKVVEMFLTFILNEAP